MLSKKCQYQIGLKILKNKKKNHQISFIKEFLYYFFQKQGLDLSTLVEEETETSLCLSFYVYSRIKAVALLRKIKKERLKGVSIIDKKHLQKDSVYFARPKYGL